MPAKKTDTPVEQVEAAVKAGKETVEAAMKAGADVAAEGYEKVLAMTKENVDAIVKAGADAFKGYEDLIAFNKDNVDAFVKCGTLFAQGMQEINKVVLGLAQTSMEDGVNATKAMFACKSVKDVVAVQSDLAKNNYETLVTEGKKLSEMSLKLAETVGAPLAARVNLAVEKLTKPLAA